MARPSKKQSRRPSVTRAPRKPKAVPVTEKTLGESIIEQMVAVNRFLADIAFQMKERNAMLSVVTNETARAAEATVGLVTTKVEEAVKHLDIKTETPATAAEIDQALAPLKKKKRGRPSKAELAARAAAAEQTPASTTLEHGSEGEPGTFAPPASEPVCPSCGVLASLPPSHHSRTCTVHPVEQKRMTPEEVEKVIKEKGAAPQGAPTPAPEVPSKVPATAAPPSPTLEDVRASAIAFAGRHGKEKLSAALQKYGADKLSSVDPSKYSALIADLGA